MTVTISNALHNASVRVNKADHTFEANVAAMPQASLDHIFAYGLRQILNDAAAGTEAGADSRAAVEKRLSNLLEGTLRASTGRTSDPVAKEARDIATRAVTSALRAKGKKPADVANFAELVTKTMARPDVQAKAKAAAKAKEGLDFDIEV